MIDSVKTAVREAARKVTLVSAACVCLAVAAGFLTAAGWIWLSDSYGGAIAGAVIGAVYALVGVVLLLLGSRKPPPKPVAPPPLTQAFMTGLLAGMQRRT